METLKNILTKLKELGCSGIKISFEDEGALLNEIISMRYLTTTVDLELSIKIGGCEAKRDIVDCISVNCDSIVSPMVESKFSLNKFLKSLQSYNYDNKKGFNLETIQSYKNLNEMSELFDQIDFITFGRVDFVGSLESDRSTVDSIDIYDMVKNTFSIAKEKNINCYLGGAISINSKDFIQKLIKEKLLDKFETRYIIYDTTKINIDNFELAIYWGNIFEVEWLKFINKRYAMHANKDIKRIEMIENRINNNKVI